MSRRYVKTARFNELNQITPEVVAVISAKDQVETVDETQKYFKRNYLQAIRKIIPKFYFADEATISGTHVAYSNQLINSHILANKNQSTILPVSALTYDTYLSSINSPEGFAKYFSRNNPPYQIDADDFQRNILYPLGKTFNNFTTSQAFAEYVSGTLLPSIPMVNADHHATDDLATLTASAFSNDSSGTYKYLVNNLGWTYFLNRSGPAPVVGKPTPFDPSTGLATLLTDTVWRGRPLVLEDNIALYQEYLWKNEPTWELDDRVIPPDYVSSLGTSAGIQTSGTQMVDRLKMLVNVVYSPHYLDTPDTTVDQSFDTYFSTSTVNLDGQLITTTQEAGPLTRFLDALSFEIADRTSEQAELNTLYDIGECPQEFLELLGELIGWKFIGSDVDKWRVQLRNATQIYKMKGTRRSVQYLLDTMFSTGVFNVNTSSTLNELWESYVPDILYYSLATSSEAFQDFDTYTPQLAQQFGVPYYDPNSMHRNIQYLVDKIIFDLVREFPNSFWLGGKPFPAPQLTLNDQPYTGPYVLVPTGGSDDGNFTFPDFYTGSVFDEDSSEQLRLSYDPNFVFRYRDRNYLVPPYEKRQYYTQTQVSYNMIQRIEYYLTCYGVGAAFAKEVTQYLINNTTNSLDEKKVINSFVLYTPEKTYPPNYATILQDVTKERTPDPANLLSMWNGKSSHFLMNFDASTFNWASQQLDSKSKYGITKVLRVLDEVLPAHAIPEILLSVSSVADGMDALLDLTCEEWRPNFNDLYEGSSTVTTGFGVCAVDMLALATANGIPQHRFKRTAVDNINDALLSGTTYASVPRNSLRRRNYHNLLPETKMFTRIGHNNPGSLELSTTYYSSSIGFIPLGFIPSSLAFATVDTRTNPNGYSVGTLLTVRALDEVWEQCNNLLSPNSFYGYDVSNTFASRAKQDISTSSCNTYGRRGQLSEIVSVMTKVNDQEKYLQASSIVSGYYEAVTAGEPPTTVSSNLLVPTDFSSWYAESAETNGIDVPKSMGNYLINKEAGDESLNYYEHFKFGSKVQELYNQYVNQYGAHGTGNMSILRGGADIFSHTYGPYIYNSNLDYDGSALDASGYLSASSPVYEVDLAYYGGSGVLSISGMNNKVGGYNLGTSAASDSGDLPLGYPEFRNKHLVSAIELVDTSSPTAFTEHPIFSLFKLSRDNQSQFSYAKYLINNQIIKYHRSSDSNAFPRLRVSIDNSDSNSLAQNFLLPNHEYEVTVKAHNLDVSGEEFGGQSLGFWIHTNPELDQVWSYKAGGIYDECGVGKDVWEPLGVASLSGTGGINLATTKAQSRIFSTGNLTNVIGSGEGSAGDTTTITEAVYDYRCWEPKLIEFSIKGNVPQAITNVNEETRQELKFKFSTYQDNPIVPSPEYRAAYHHIHRKDQKYTLEFFVMQGDERRFVVFEDIEVKDITNYNKAVIQTKYGDAQLDMLDLKAVIRFFKTLSTGVASRNSTITSGTMETSGGSRLNYRSNSSMYTTDENATYKQLTEVLFDEG